MLPKPSDCASKMTSITDKITQNWLDRLWSNLFDGHEAGLLSPSQIRREHRDRVAVRQVEMAAIFDAERDINHIHQGLKCIDSFGNLLNTPKIDTFYTHSIIENSGIETLSDVVTESSASMLKTAAREVGIRDLERALNLRKIILLAETEIYNAADRVVSQSTVSIEWMLCWKSAAQDVFNPEIQLILARMLIHEIAEPGSYAMSGIHVLTLLNADDLEMLAILSKYSLGRFIFNATSGYFDSELHINLLENMDDLGLISGYGMDISNKNIPSCREDYYEYTLHCGNKAMRVVHDDAEMRLVLPVFKVSRAGRQLMTLHSSVPDLAYLYEIAAHIKEQGFSVSLGDWDGVENNGVFIEKMAL
jgi:hypothetical protein